MADISDFPRISWEFWFGKSLWSSCHNSSTCLHLFLFFSCAPWFHQFVVVFFNRVITRPRAQRVPALMHLIRETYRFSVIIGRCCWSICCTHVLHNTLTPLTNHPHVSAFSAPPPPFHTLTLPGNFGHRVDLTQEIILLGFKCKVCVMISRLNVSHVSWGRLCR